MNLSGYGLSDDASKVKWTFPGIVLPAKSYLVVFASGSATSNADAIFQHTGFKLGASDGGVYLMDSSGSVLDKIEYQNQMQNVSLGRDPGDSTQWSIFEKATPGFQTMKPDMTPLFKAGSPLTTICCSPKRCRQRNNTAR